MLSTGNRFSIYGIIKRNFENKGKHRSVARP